MTISFFRPYRDELVSSAIVRGCRHFDISLAVLGLHLRGRRSWTLRFAGAADLSSLSDLLQSDPMTLLWQHTFHPYSTAFASRHPFSSSVSFNSPKPMRTAFQHRRRFCQACCEEDVLLYGESYWHRQHQLPGTMLCVRHRSSLRESAHRLAGAHRDLELPQDITGNACGPVNQSWRLVADASVHLLLGDSLAATSRTSDFYRGLAQQKAWLASGSAVSEAPLVSSMRSFYGEQRLIDAGAELATDDDWPALLMQPRCKVPMSPLKHVLLEQFLRHFYPQRELQLSHRPTGPSAEPRRDLDARCFASARRKLVEIRKASSKVAIAHWLEEAGCWQAFRHSTEEELPRLNALVAEFRRSRTALRQEIRFTPSLPARRSQAKLLRHESGRSQASFQVPATDDLNPPQRTRLDLIRGGELRSSKDMAERLGVHWTEMKRLTKQRQIICIRYASRDFYPSFWSDCGVERDILSKVLAALGLTEGAQQYSFFTEHSVLLDSTPLFSLQKGRLSDVLNLARDHK